MQSVAAMVVMTAACSAVCWVVCWVDSLVADLADVMVVMKVVL